MIVLSLFDGMSCGQIALNRVGLYPSKYFSSEIDKYAIEVTQKNYPDTIQIGDVTKVSYKNRILYTENGNFNTGKIDLVIGGSPCQGFSFSGKQLNFEDHRSKLFFEYVRILREVNPTHFLLENVKMKKDYKNVITQHLGVEPIEINSALVSAQNRVRLYWTNINGVVRPEDKKIYLSDIIENGVVDRDKSYCIDANYWKGTNVDRYINKARRQLVFELPVAFTERRTEEAKRIRREYKEKYGRDFSPRRAKELAPRSDGKMNCLTATYSFKEHTIIDENINYRKLTPIECERLQTIPDNYTAHVSNSQRYKMIGNGWNIDTIVCFFKQIKIKSSTDIMDEDDLFDLDW